MSSTLEFHFVITIFVLTFTSIKIGGVNPPVAKPNCQDSCGGVTIPYPFGIGENCYKNKWFEIICKNDFNNSFFPILSVYKLKVANISDNELQVLHSWGFSSCNPGESGIMLAIMQDNLGEYNPFLFSQTNKMFAFGCDIFAYVSSNDNPHKSSYTNGCISTCQDRRLNGSICTGQDYCVANLPTGLPSIYIDIRKLYESSHNASCCSDAFIVADDLFNFSSRPAEVPMRMSWVISNFTCDNTIPSKYCGENAHCNDQILGLVCKCDDGYRGNPYLPSGCIDVDECQERTFTCGDGAFCYNTPGSYHCYCQHGYTLQPDRSCTVDMRIKSRSSMIRFVALGLTVALSVAVAMAGTVLCAWKLKKKKESQLRKMHFKRNGGLLLKQQIASKEDSVVKTQIFGLDELERATDYFNERRMCGKGGFGAVYKGMLDDGRIVAIKRSHIVHEKQVSQFINEVVILSRIIHRNIVKLLGCCLETEVPLLVYEFIGNGTLSRHLHDEDSVLSISWEARVKVGQEIASALAYMHSAASTPIFHRDVKSSNILLDDNYNAKISDFGISRSIPIEQTHLSTALQGTFGYLDPEYFHSNQFTDKSDVYSFGVVLVEILTGERAVSKTKVEVEEKSLVLNFKLAMKEDRLFDILDPYVRHQGTKGDILEFAKLAKKCVKLNGKRRPTMKEASAEIEKIIKVMKLIDHVNVDVDSPGSSTVLSTESFNPLSNH